MERRATKAIISKIQKLVVSNRRLAYCESSGVDDATPNPSGVFDWRGGRFVVVPLIPPTFFYDCTFWNAKGLQAMNDNIDIFDLFREVFSVKTTDIAELMPTKAEQLEEVLK